MENGYSGQQGSSCSRRVTCCKDIKEFWEFLRDKLDTLESEEEDNYFYFDNPLDLMKERYFFFQKAADDKAKAVLDGGSLSLRLVLVDSKQLWEMSNFASPTTENRTLQDIGNTARNK